jgi:hypothetical protein
MTLIHCKDRCPNMSIFRVKGAMVAAELAVVVVVVIKN